MAKKTAARKKMSPSTRAGEYVREEVEHIRQGKHGARSSRQAIAIGMSKARRAGIKVPPVRGKTPPRRPPATGRKNPVRARASLHALQREGTAAASHTALSRQVRRSARRRGRAGLQAAARKAARTKGPGMRRNAARKAARTRARLAS
jgi:hypothetical protein